MSYSATQTTTYTTTTTHTTTTTTTTLYTIRRVISMTYLMHRRQTAYRLV